MDFGKNEMNYNREWYLIGKPYCGNRGKYIVEIWNRFDKGIAFQLLAECKETFDRWKNVKSAFVLLF